MAQPASKNSELREPENPLRILPAMLHAVFCQTADVFNSPQRQQPRAIMYTNAEMRMSIPTCNARFQYALDLLEIDILSAKAVLHRDLALLRKEAEARNAERLALERQAREAEEARKRQEAEAAAAAAKAKAEAEAAEAHRREAEAAEKRRLEAEAQLALQQQQQQQQQQQKKKPEPIIIDDESPNAPKDPTPQTAGDGSFDFLFATSPIEPNCPADGGVNPPRQAPQPASGSGAGNANSEVETFDFMASTPAAAGPVDIDHTMGGGQPLEGSFYDFNDFNDLFTYGSGT